mmetsp:Transcript_16356/g.25911  ORF Transcript_16356/g.25911 Transcript_16356/m.25911 type:complete len:401 (-) Transcript_16356:71-1273(-)
MAIFELETVSSSLDVDTLHILGGVETLHVDLVVEVTDISDDAVVLHLRHMVEHDDILVSGGGDNDVDLVDNVLEGNDLETLHAGLKSTDWVDLSDQGVGTASLHGLGRALADITVTADKGGLTGNHDIGGTHNTVRERVLAAVEVVKLRLSDGVVDVDGGEEKALLLSHLFETVNTSGGLLGDSDDARGDLGPQLGVQLKSLFEKVENAVLVVAGGGGRVGKSPSFLEGLLSRNTLVDEKGCVSAVVDDHVGTAGLGAGPHERLVGAVPVLRDGLSLPGEHIGSLGRGNASCGVVLGGEDVARCPAHLGAKVLKRLDKHSGLNGHMQGSGNVGSGKGVLVLAFGADSHETGHLNLSDVELLAAELGKTHVLDLGGLQDGEIVQNGQVHVLCVVRGHLSAV